MRVAYEEPDTPRRDFVLRLPKETDMAPSAEVVERILGVIDTSWPPVCGVVPSTPRLVLLRLSALPRDGGARSKLTGNDSAPPLTSPLRAMGIA